MMAIASRNADTQFGAFVSSGGCGATLFDALGDNIEQCWKECYRRKSVKQPDLENQLADDFTLPFVARFDPNAPRNGRPVYEIVPQRTADPIHEHSKSFRVSEAQLRKAGMQNILSSTGRFVATLVGAGTFAFIAKDIDNSIGTMTSAASMGGALFKPLYALLERCMAECIRRRRINKNSGAIDGGVIEAPFAIRFRRNGSEPISIILPPSTVPAEQAPPNEAEEQVPPKQAKEQAAATTTSIDGTNANVRLRTTAAAANVEPAPSIQAPSRASTDQTMHST